MKNPPDAVLNAVRGLSLQRIILNLDPNQYKQGKNVSYLFAEIKCVMLSLYAGT